MDTDNSDLPEGIYPYGNLPGDTSQPTPQDLERKNRLKQFVDLDELQDLSRDEKIQLTQNVAERFDWNHLNGMNGTIGYSPNIRPEITDSEVVHSYRIIATDLWHQGTDRLLSKMDNETLELLKSVGQKDGDGSIRYFESIIKPPKKEPHPDNPFLRTEAFVYHDARLLDALIKELYIDPQKGGK